MAIGGYLPNRDTILLSTLIFLLTALGRFVSIKFVEHFVNLFLYPSVGFPYEILFNTFFTLRNPKRGPL